MTNPILPDEQKLLSAIAKGDQYAFTQLFNHYQKFVYGFARKLTHSEELAINIVQDVFLKVWEARAKLERVDDFGAWLNRVVRNHAFNMLRDLSAKAKNTVALESVQPPAEDTTGYQLDYNETLRLVNEAVAQLSPQQRLAYQLCHQQGLKYEQAAVQMNISAQTLHVHMKYALRKIREHLRNNTVMYPLLVMAILK